MSEHTNERTETHACDCISRQTAIDALNNRAENVSLKTRIGLLDAVRVIDELPSVEPERKPGKWIKVVNPDTNEWTGGLKCSECDRDCVQMSMNFCANCGAPMEVDG